MWQTCRARFLADLQMPMLNLFEQLLADLILLRELVREFGRLANSRSRNPRKQVQLCYIELTKLGGAGST